MWQLCSLSLTGWFLNTLGSFNRITLVYRVLFLWLLYKETLALVSMSKSQDRICFSPCFQIRACWINPAETFHTHAQKHCIPKSSLFGCRNNQSSCRFSQRCFCLCLLSPHHVYLLQYLYSFAALCHNKSVQEQTELCTTSPCRTLSGHTNSNLIRETISRNGNGDEGINRETESVLTTATAQATTTVTKSYYHCYYCDNCNYNYVLQYVNNIKHGSKVMKLHQKYFK